MNSSAAGSAGGSPSGKQFVEKVEDIKAVIGDVLPRSRQDLKIELGISKLAVYNFGVQAALTLVSWAVLFATLHHNIGKVGGPGQYKFAKGDIQPLCT